MQPTAEKPEHILELEEDIAKYRHFIDGDAMQLHAIKKIKALLDLQGFKRPSSHKAKAWLQSRVFAYEYTKDRLYYAATVSVDGPNFTIMLHILQVIPTKKGKMYVMQLNDAAAKISGIKYGCYTAHFFDRYKERNHLNGSRAKTVLSFLREIVTMPDSRVSYEDSKWGKKLFVNFRTGVGLGTEHERLNLYTTYVSNELLEPKQRLKAAFQSVSHKALVKYEKMKDGQTSELLRALIQQSMQEENYAPIDLAKKIEKIILAQCS